MALFPNVPTDSLYKFVALFGLLILAFGLWYPEQKMRESNAGIQEAAKTARLTQIKLNRKNARADKLVDELKLRSEVLEKKRRPLEEAQAALDAKRNAVIHDLNSLLKNGKGDVEGATKRAEALKPESEAMVTALTQMKSEVDKLNAEYRTVIDQQEDLTDEMETQNVHLKASLETMNDLKSQSEVWLNHMISCIAFGWTMIFVGFGFWYVRIQRHEDAILRQRAKGLKDGAAGTLPQPQAAPEPPARA